MKKSKASASPAEPLQEESASKEVPDSFDESFISGMVTTMELGGRRQPPLPSRDSQVETGLSPSRVPPDLNQSSTTASQNLASGIQDGDRQETEDFLDDSPIVDQLENQSEAATRDPAPTTAVRLASEIPAGMPPPTGMTRPSAMPPPSGSSAARVAKQSTVDHVGPRDDALRAGSVAQRGTSYSPAKLAAISQQAATPKPKKSKKLLTLLRAACYAAVTFLALVGMAALGYALAVSDLLG